MKLLTAEEAARQVPARWRAQYERRGHLAGIFMDERKARIAAELEALPERTPDAIARVIGNRSWTNIECDECGETELDAAVMVGQSPDIDSATAILCRKCAADALAMFSEATE